MISSMACINFDADFSKKSPNIGLVFCINFETAALCYCFTYRSTADSLSGRMYVCVCLSSESYLAENIATKLGYMHFLAFRELSSIFALPSYLSTLSSIERGKRILTASMSKQGRQFS